MSSDPFQCLLLPVKIIRNFTSVALSWRVCCSVAAANAASMLQRHLLQLRCSTRVTEFSRAASEKTGDVWGP